MNVSNQFSIGESTYSIRLLEAPDRDEFSEFLSRFYFEQFHIRLPPLTVDHIISTFLKRNSLLNCYLIRDAQRRSPTGYLAFEPAAQGPHIFICSAIKTHFSFLMTHLWPWTQQLLASLARENATVNQIPIQHSFLYTAASKYDAIRNAVLCAEGFSPCPQLSEQWIPRESLYRITLSTLTRPISHHISFSFAVCPPRTQEQTLRSWKSLTQPN